MILFLVCTVLCVCVCVCVCASACVCVCQDMKEREESALTVALQTRRWNKNSRNIYHVLLCRFFPLKSESNISSFFVFFIITL